MKNHKTIQEEENELYEHFRIIVDPGQNPLRIDKFLMQRIENASRNKIQNAAKAGNILVNEQTVKSNYKVRPADIISIVLSHPPREIEIIPEDIALDIIYEDDDILVVNKAAGMVVHPAYGNYTGTLVNALTYYLRKRPGHEDAFPLLVHRIDKDTTGLLLVAKNELVQTKLAGYFFNHDIDRKYIALVWGNLDEDEGTIRGNLGRSSKDRKIMTVYDDPSKGKKAITHFKVIKRYGYVTLVECVLETGRTHQIRAHFKHIKHPLFNDGTYGGNIILKGTTFTKYKQFVQNCFSVLPRQALHAKSLGFRHPSSGEYMGFDSELPEDFSEVLNKWDRYTNQ